MNMQLTFNFESKDDARKAFSVVDTCLKKVLASCELVESIKLDDTQITACGALNDIDEDIDEGFFLTLSDILACALPKAQFTGEYKINSKTIRESASFLRASKGNFAIISDEFDFDSEHVIVGFLGEAHESSDKDWEITPYDNLTEFSIDYYDIFKNTEFTNNEFDNFLVDKEQLKDYEFVYEEDEYEYDEYEDDEYEDMSEEEMEQKISEIFNNKEGE